MAPQLQPIICAPSPAISGVLAPVNPSSFNQVRTICFSQSYSIIGHIWRGIRSDPGVRADPGGSLEERNTVGNIWLYLVFKELRIPYAIKPFHSVGKISTLRDKAYVYLGKEESSLRYKAIYYSIG